MFNNILSQQFKSLFNEAIDELISQNGLSVPCTLVYDSLKKSLCPNCIFDPIQNRSNNEYNNTGPVPFPTLGICPICNGYGIIDMSSQDTVYLAVIFDSKYWFNWDYKSVNIGNNMAQSIGKIELLPKIQNTKEIILDTNVAGYGSRRYSRSGDSQICGLGSNRYIITMWEKII
jgi:hypothetical protein